MKRYIAFIVAGTVLILSGKGAEFISNIFVNPWLDILLSIILILGTLYIFHGLFDKKKE